LDLPSGGQQVAAFTGHNSAVNAVAFSGDGNLLATGSGDGTVRFWDLDTKEQVATFSGDGTDDVFSLALDQNGTQMLRAGAESTLLVRGIVRTPQEACERVEAEVTEDELRAALGGEAPRACTNLP